MSKYRVVEYPWVGLSGRVYNGYSVEQKFLWFFWIDGAAGRIFDKKEEAEQYVENFLLGKRDVVREYS